MGRAFTLSKNKKRKFAGMTENEIAGTIAVRGTKGGRRQSKGAKLAEERSWRARNGPVTVVKPADKQQARVNRGRDRSTFGYSQGDDDLPNPALIRSS